MMRCDACALQDLEHAQRVADRAYHHLLEKSDMRRYAADVDQHLAFLRHEIDA